MKRSDYREQKQTLLSLLDMLREGHALEFSLAETFTAPNPLVTSMEHTEAVIRKTFSESPLRPALSILLKGAKNNRARTIELVEQLVEIIDRNHQVARREQEFRKSLFFRSCVTSAGIAGSLGVLSILTLSGFLQFSSSMDLFLHPYTPIEVICVFVSIVTSLIVSTTTTAHSVAKEKKRKLLIYVISLVSFILTSVLSYLFLKML